jgi:glycosyltransferase involved in cell wall biosynthesis
VKNKPLISIIITNYNYGQYIEKAIRSVVNQTYSNIELIIINDGSTDDSDEVIKKIVNENSNRNIRYVNRKNRGVVYTRNEGIKLAKGEFISYLDADDYFNQNYISKSYKVAAEHGVDVVYPNWHFVGEWLGRPDTDFPEFTLEKLQLQELHCTPASLIRKSAIKDHRFEVEKVAEDWDFFIGLSLDGLKFKLVKDNPINYRIRKGTRGSMNDPKDDTDNFVEILTKYKAVYGDKVIDPRKLVKSRHPSIAMKVLKMRYPRVVIQSIKKDGVRTTAVRLAGKVASRNEWVWKTVGYTRNKKYQKLAKSFKIKKSPNTKLAVVVHLYYPDAWPFIKEKLKNITVPFDIFVSVRQNDKDTVLDRVSKYHKVTNIVALPNRGRDVLPFMLIVSKISSEGQYKYLLKIHGKKSLHRKDGSEWLESLLSQLIPSDTSRIIMNLEKANTGIIGPADHITSLSRYMGGNRARIESLLELMTDRGTTEHILKAPSRYPFFGGTMFWCRVDFLQPLLKSGIKPADFNSERGQVDATTAHAIERILGKILHTVSGKKMYIVKDSLVSELPEKLYSSKYKYVE